MTNNAADTFENSTDHASYLRARETSEKIEAALAKDPSQFRVLTGDRPTGHLHIGHYFGSLHNRVRLQRSGVETWLVIADYQVITDRDGVGPIKERVYSLLADYLAAGIDPSTATIFVHSAVPPLNQLMLPFLSLVTESELHRNPTVKAELEAATGRTMTGLMLTYPVHQTADILFCKANLVPVGKDQLPHLEQARVIADRFESHYGHPEGSDSPIFPRPYGLLSESDTILGLDGAKMSKSRHNTIELRMDADETARLIRKAVTDSERFITYDPENRPEVSNLLTIAALCQNRPAEEIAAEIGNGGGGMLKKVVTESLNEYLAEHRARRVELEKDPAQLQNILHEGIERANAVADSTLAEVREAMRMVY
ncbi:tryptophan--tRNA ligase [Actinobaculum sp. 352]|uniref:tryptophan--tRNA ligase n=1 Tax=Actinobaculum sp. 352 TaxID=2490946 RepID=UPI000F7DED25|nr:tryptophan--tRNA ligase [Actinobaculum sp. 352]RTE49049.1 tryptophan--tRNA ligase [Actinobaculum sp. 352]